MQGTQIASQIADAGWQRAAASSAAKTGSKATAQNGVLGDVLLH
jgi:hypothetical protein